MVFSFFWAPFGSIFGIIFPIFFFVVMFRVLRGIFYSSTRDLESKIRRERVSFSNDNFETITSYPPIRRNDGYEVKIFRLAQQMKGRITLSDIVIATNLGLKEAERVIDGMVDGVHVSMEVNDKGRVVYEFPEIITRFEDDTTQA